MNQDSKIFVAGGSGMVGAALIRQLVSRGFNNIISTFHSRKPADSVASSVAYTKLDLTRQAEVEAYFEKEQPEYVFLAAARVGGIFANSSFKAEFIYQNTMIATNVIHSAYRYGARKLLNLGSSCIYPRLAPQPMKEEYLLSGALEPTNEPYAVAKIAAIKLCRYYNEQYGTDFLSVMPTNLYGPCDNFDLMNSHVLPAMIRKFHCAGQNKAEGKRVELWGTGSPLREFLYVDDLADACIFLMNRYSASDIGEFVNIGSGQEISIRALAELIQFIIGSSGEIIWDSTKPDGTPRKLLDISRIRALGWEPKTTLEEGIRKTYAWYLQQQK